MFDLNNVDINESLKYEGGSVLYRSESGVIVWQGENSTVMSNITVPEELCAAIKTAGVADAGLFSLKSEAVADSVCRMLGFKNKTSCSQWVYTAKQPLQGDFSNVRTLTDKYIDVVGKTYGKTDHTEYAADRIAAGRMWGLFEGDELAGFIGMHSEGSIGMLEVLPEFRRKGYGYILEAFVINMHLQNGRTPYCHVINGNDASNSLQQKLGYTKASLPAVWISKEK